MNTRTHMQPYLSNSLAIRQEIQRFESVHPSIYAIYDLIELIPDPLLAQQIREHVVCIEDSFVNSQEWTLGRSVPDIKLGIVGSLSSGKSALVHRYLTGSYMQEESPEGGRFKKEIVIEGQSYLLLIRDEGGPPELQFTSWVDAVIFVFSLENEASFNAIYNYYAKMAHYRNTAEVPLILVGTQDAISESNPRVIDDSRARKLASDLKRCSYYETCATYGLNVERVFQDACQKIVQQRMAALTPTNSRPSTPNHSLRYYIPSPTNNGFSSHSNQSSNASTSPSSNLITASPSHSTHNIAPCSIPTQDLKDIKLDKNVLEPPKEQKELTTPSSTPTTSRKSRRRSNLFTPKKGDEDKKSKNGEMGSGRVIPIKQGHLYKRSSKSLNKEWKKKYVTLCDDGRLTYHPSLHDYMDDVHGKEISLVHTTVKVPGQRPRGTRTNPSANGLTNGINNLSLGGYLSNAQAINDESIVFTSDVGELLKRRSGSVSSICEDAIIISNSLLTSGLMNYEDQSANSKVQTPIIKKRQRRFKSSGSKNGEMDESDGYEFIIVSLDNKQWHFEAANIEERDAWVAAIEQQILSCLQGNESSKSKSRMNSLVDAAAIQAIRNVRGNNYCVDCEAANPDWSSINLGALMCIECSGIHRNLGSHISRVRSLDLDEWPSENISVMMALGNHLANGIWETNLHGKAKPTPNSSREEKERWIRAKYELKEFLAPLPTHNLSINQQLIDAVCKTDLRMVVLLLAYATAEQVNCPVSSRDQRTALHLACTLGNVVMLQLLIWYNANVKLLDQEGRSALVYARNAGSRECVDILLHNGCPDTSSISGTLPRRKGSISRKNPEVFDKLPASVI